MEASGRELGTAAVVTGLILCAVAAAVGSAVAVVITVVMILGGSMLLLRAEPALRDRQPPVS